MILFTVLVLAAAVSSLALSLTTSKTACRHTLLKAGSLRMISTSGGDFDSADGRPSKEEEVVRRVLYSPNTVPSSDELKIVLNSLKHLYDTGTKSETFMERCRKQKVLDGFRAMEEDHPLQNLNLADVEKLFTEHPKIMEALTNVSVSAFNFPSVPSIGIEGLQVVAP